MFYFPVFLLVRFCVFSRNVFYSNRDTSRRDLSIMTLVTGNLFITGHFSGLICLWSADLGKMIDVFENAHTNQITDVVFGNIFGKDEYILANDTGNSLSEVLIYSSIYTQYDKRLFNELRVQYKKTTNSEHVVYTNWILFLF